GRSESYYRPLFVLWSILNFKIFGLHAWGWHLATVLLHLAATCTVYFFARALKLEHWTACLSAFLFGLHPIHSEGAAWISAGSDSLVTLLYMLAFIGFLKSREQDIGHKRLWQIASYFFLLCALFTKEMAVTFPLLVTLYVWLRNKPKAGKHLVQLWRFLLTAAPYFLITLSYVILRKLALHRPTKLDPNHTTLDVVLTLPSVLFAYLRLLIFPKDLTGLYYSTYAIPIGFWNFVLPLLVLCLFVAIIFCWTKRTGDPIVSFSTLWMIARIIPMLYLRALPSGKAVRDRYLYLPSVGFVFLVAKAIHL